MVSKLYGDVTWTRSCEERCVSETREDGLVSIISMYHGHTNIHVIS